MRARHSLGALLFAVAVVSVYLLWWQSRPVVTTPRAANQLQDVTLAAFQLYTSAVVVAADRSEAISPGKRCFVDAGLRPSIIKRSKGPDIVDALISGSADFGTLAVTPQVLQALQGSDLVIFATIQTTNHDIKVVGRRSAGIVQGASLAGKRIGYVGGTVGEMFLDRYLQKQGLLLKDVSVVSAPPAQLRDLFLTRALDAIVIWEPFVQDILADPSTDIVDVFVALDRDLYEWRMNLVARPEILKNKADQAQRLVQAMICGEDVIRVNPDVAREQLELWLDRKPGSLRNIFDLDTFRVTLNTQELLRDLGDEAQWANHAVFHDKAIIPKDFSRFVNTSIMRTVAISRIQK